MPLLLPTLLRAEDRGQVRPIIKDIGGRAGPDHQGTPHHNHQVQEM